MNSDHQNISTECPLKVEELNPGLETRKLFATVEEVIKISKSLKRLRLLDSQGRQIFCLLLNHWAEKDLLIKKGFKAVMGPCLLKAIPSKSELFPSSSQSSKPFNLYLHYEEKSLFLEFSVKFQELSEADMLGFTGNSGNISGIIVDRQKSVYQGHIVDEIFLADKKSRIRVKFLTNIEVLAVGQLVLLFAVKFFNGSCETFGVADEDSEWIIADDLILQGLGLSRLKEVRMDFEDEMNRGDCLNFAGSPLFCHVLKRFDHFPSFGMFFYVVFDQAGFYFLNSFCRVNVGWVKITKARLAGGYVEVDDLSSVSQFPEWLNPVKSLILNHWPRLEIVRQEALRGTTFMELLNEFI
jgi:hypothetical protein